MSVSAPDRRHSLAKKNTVSMPVMRKAHHSQFMLTPPLRTISVTRFGVSVEKVVATMGVPSSHHGSLRPERKYCSRLRPARLVNSTPMARLTMP
jgi:hypothetical protein